ncbi:MAG: alpha/beta hydrolase family protein [Alphaproteobacteria bacterium]
MFEYFPTNYGWTLSVACCLSMGGELTEVHEACKPLVPFAEAPLAVGNEAWYQSWMSVSERVEAQGDAMLAKGWEFSAGARYFRAAQYGFVAERHASWKAPRKMLAYRRASALFAKAVKLLGHRTERIEVPFAKGSLAGYLRLPEGKGPFPTIVMLNGFDGIKEMQYGFAGDEAVKRGIAVIFIDQDGTGESARFHAMPKPVESEKAVSAFIDRLEKHPDVDRDRIGVIGCSNGGYDAPRAAIHEPRLKLAVSFGAFYNGDCLRPMFEDLIAHPERPRRGLDFGDQVQAVMAREGLQEAFDAWCERTLEGQLAGLKVPYLILHGENDRLVPLHFAERCLREAVNSPRAELKVFSIAEGSTEHCGIDLMASHSQYMFDWVAEIFGGRVKAA